MRLQVYKTVNCLSPRLNNNCRKINKISICEIIVVDTLEYLTGLFLTLLRVLKEALYFVKIPCSVLSTADQTEHLNGTL